MNVYVKGGIIAAVVVVLVGLWYRHEAPKLPANQSPESFQLIDQMEKEGVPDFTLDRLDGKPLSLSEFKGKVVIVNFWASWCNPCVQEFPSMIELVKKLKGKAVVIAVATDDDKKDVESFVKAFGLPKPGFEIVWDHEKKVMRNFGVEKIPESFLVGGDGKLIRKVLGIENWSTDSAIEFFNSLK